jgi:hypothetical protein
MTPQEGHFFWPLQLFLFSNIFVTNSMEDTTFGLPFDASRTLPYVRVDTLAVCTKAQQPIFISKPNVVKVDNLNTMEKGKERRTKGLRKNS